MSISRPGEVSLWRWQADPRRRLTRVVVSLGRRGADGWRWMREAHLQRWFLPAELYRCLARAGLRLCALWYPGREDGQAGGAGWVQFLAQKPVGMD